MRQANYDEVYESATALGIRAEDVGFWPSRSEIKDLEKLVNEEIEKLEQKAERAEIDIKEVTKEAKTQAEAIY